MVEGLMAGKLRPSLRAKTLSNVMSSNLSETDKQCIQRVFEQYEEKQCVKHPCQGCVYYKACGESTRIVPCKGRMTATELRKERR